MAFKSVKDLWDTRTGISMLLKNDWIKRDLISNEDLNIFVQKIEIKGNEHLESGPKWTVKGGDSDGPLSGRSRESWRSIQKWKFLSQTGRSFEPNKTGKDDRGRSSEP